MEGDEGTGPQCGDDPGIEFVGFLFPTEHGKTSIVASTAVQEPIALTWSSCRRWLLISARN
jgi:hypothetical protein